MSIKNGEEKSDKTASPSEVKDKSLGKRACEGGCLREEKREIERGNIAFFRKSTDEIAIALIWAVDKEKKTASFNHFSKGTAGKCAFEDKAPIGKKRGQIWHSLEELEQEVIIDRSGIRQLVGQ